MKIQKESLTFDDVLLIPKYSEIPSRLSECISTETDLTKNIKIPTPFISSNMDSITEIDMALAMNTNGGVGIFHRFYRDYNTLLTQITLYAKTKREMPVTSIGINQFNRIVDLIKIRDALGISGLIPVRIDVAHANNKDVLEFIKQIKTNFKGELSVIGGNVCTAEGTMNLINVDVDAVCVGIGGGSVCSTRIVTGCGVPQLSAVIDCYEVARHYNIPIISDGGIRYPSDAVKALAAGASTVMMGREFASCKEAPHYGFYRGQSSA